MQEDLVKSIGRYIKRPLKFTLKARVWRWGNGKYVLAIVDSEVAEVFKSLVSNGARALIEVNTPVATFSYMASGRITKRNGHEYVIFHAVKTLNETWKDLYWFGDFTVIVYIPVRGDS